MRLILLVLNLVIGSSLLGLATDSNAAPHPKHPSNKQKLPVYGKLLKPFELSAYRPRDVWERIRTGMGVQMYSLPDKFIFQAKGEISLDPVQLDINPLLKSPAVQARLYKFQRYNIAALKNLLKHPNLPIINQNAEWHTAQQKPESITIAALSTPKTASLIKVSDPGCVNNLPKASPNKVSAPKQPPFGLMQTSFVQPSMYDPDIMPKIALHIEPITPPIMRACASPAHEATIAQTQRPSATRINYSLKLPNPLQQKSVYARVQKQIAWFSQRPEYLQMVAERARPYLYHIVEELSRHKLPLELALLPIVESAYKPTAQSPMSAAGLWQFIPSTGRDFNLKQNDEYDERLDVTTSTQAAIRFLAKLNKHFKGDWLLALAAYNCGQGNVDAAIRRNTARGLPTDYWSLSLPEETQNYVPRLLALANIFANPTRYQLHVKPVKNEPYFVKVNIDDQAEMAQLMNKDFKSVAALADISYEQFSRLNPGYLNKTLTGQGPFKFILPIANANKLQQKLLRFASAEPEQPASSPFLSAKFTGRFDPSTAAIVEDVLLSKQSMI